MKLSKFNNLKFQSYKPGKYEIPNLKKQLNIAELELINFKSSDGNNFIFDSDFRVNSIESLNQEIKEIELKEIELKEFYKCIKNYRPTKLEVSQGAVADCLRFMNTF